MDRSEIRRDKGSPPATPKRRKGVCVGEKDRAGSSAATGCEC